jgi:hypothetical protein
LVELPAPPAPTFTLTWPAENEASAWICAIVLIATVREPSPPPPPENARLAPETAPPAPPPPDLHSMIAAMVLADGVYVPLPPPAIVVVHPEAQKVWRLSVVVVTMLAPDVLRPRPSAIEPVRPPSEETPPAVDRVRARARDHDRVRARDAAG